MIAKLWRYIKVAKFAYLGWVISFVVTLSLPDIEKTPAWYWMMAATLVGITVMVVGIQALMEARYEPRDRK